MCYCHSAKLAWHLAWFFPSHFWMCNLLLENGQLMKDCIFRENWPLISKKLRTVTTFSGYNFVTSTPPHTGIWSGLGLHKSCAWYYRHCEFICSVSCLNWVSASDTYKARHCYLIVIQHPWLLASFCSLIYKDSWAFPGGVVVCMYHIGLGIL